MKNTISNPTNACINFMYFMTNFSTGFIQKCWSDEPLMADHLQEKYDNIAKKEKMAIVKFFFEIDREQQIKFVEWVNTNYVSFPSLFDKEELPLKVLASGVYGITNEEKEFEFKLGFTTTTFTKENSNNNELTDVRYLIAEITMEDVLNCFDKDEELEKIKEKYYNLVVDSNELIKSKEHEFINSLSSFNLNKLFDFLQNKHKKEFKLSDFKEKAMINISGNSYLIDKEFLNSINDKENKIKVELILQHPSLEEYNPEIL